MRALLVVPAILAVLACGIPNDDAPTPEECVDFSRASAVEERRLNPDPVEEARMSALCAEVMRNWGPTVSPSKQSLREEFPYVPGRYYAGGSVHYVRVDPVGMRVHLEGGCPEGEISGSLHSWILDEINEMCGGGVTVR